MTATPAIAVLGLGEAGTAIASDIALAGNRVIGFDPVQPAPEGVESAAGAREAAAAAAVVLSVNSAAVAAEVAEAVAPALEARHLYADLNTGAPALKRSIAAVVEARGASFADVALMEPVPDWGVRTPALASGPGAEQFQRIFGAFGTPVTFVGDEPGAAAARKLARSVFMKGQAAAIGEALAAAERLGFEEWLYADIESTLTRSDGRLLRRLVEGSRKHAGRRVDEMAAAVEMLEELDVEPRVSAASEAWLRSLAASQVGR
jgi:3-hydroxyisobutyrate dehydrogenase-like beta-hydroxyacid dehydrogenase